MKIELGLQPDTVDKIKDLSEKTNTPNYADTISSSVNLASELVDEVKKGAKIFIEKDGLKQELKITNIGQ